MLFVFITLVSFIATFLSAMSGSGSSMIAVPVWVSLGFSLPAAISANVLNGALWTPVAARNYLHDTRIDKRLCFYMILLGLAGAWFGTDVVVGLDQAVLTKVVGLIILTLAAFLLLKSEFGVKKQEARWSTFVTALGSFPLGFYEAFFGAGNGIFTSTLLVKGRGFELPIALGYYYVVSFFWCSFATALFARKGYALAELMIPSSIGGIIGAYCGSRIGKRNGARFVKRLVLILGTILGTKLVLGL